MIKFNFEKDVDNMFKKNKMLYVISSDFNKRMRFILEKVKLCQFKKILIITEKNRLKETVSLILKMKLTGQIVLVNFESLNKVVELDIDNFRILKTNNDLKNYVTKLSDSQIKPAIIRGNFRKPDVIVIDSAHKLGAYPKPIKAAQELRKLSQGIPILASGFTITSNGKLPKIFHQLYAFNRTKHKNFHDFTKEFINVKDINSRYSIISTYDELNVKGKRWYDNVINNIVVDIDNENRYKDNNIIHTLTIPEKISSMINDIYNNNVLEYRGNKYQIAEIETKHKYIHQLLSGTLKLQEKYLIIDDFKAKFIKKHYGKNKILIIYRYLSEKKVLDKIFGQSNQFVLRGYVNDLPNEKFDYIIFHTLPLIISKYQNILSKYNNIKKVYVFSRNSMESDIYNKLKMQLNSL